MVTSRICLRLTPTMNKKIEEKSKEIGVTKNAFISNVLWNYFERKEVR